jgi:CRP-like cAMP-binding protein
LVSSAVVSAVIGLALQDVLGNVVAGVALHVGKPFKVGDWVKVSDQVGAVVQTSWRSTTISTLDGDFVIIPNGSIAKAEIVNFSAPNPQHAEHARVGTRYEVPPNSAKKAMIEAALQTQGVVPEPRPKVRLIEFGDFSINYDMKYWIDDFSQHDDIRDAVMSSIWYHFRRQGIGIPFPIRDVNLFTVTTQEREKEEAKRIAGLMRLLEAVDIFSPLSSEERLQVAQGVQTHRYAPGERIVRQGDEGDSFFIIGSGQVEVSAQDQTGSQGVLARLGPGKFFGEMSLLTGERRSATVTAVQDTEVGVIDKDNFARVLTANPDIAQTLSEILERRLAEIAAKMADLEKERSDRRLATESRGSLLKRIRSFFRL